MAKSRDVRRKKDILTEFETTLQVCKKLVSKGYCLRSENLLRAQKERDDYWTQSLKPYADGKHNDYKWAMKSAKQCAELLATSICEKFDEEFDHNSIFSIQNYNVDGRLDGSKGDLVIKEYDATDPSELIGERHISLKAYEKDSSIQVCSGTYISTILCLAFDKVSVGQYTTAQGKKVPRAEAKNIAEISALFQEDYGQDIQPLLQDIKALDKNFKPLVQSRYPGDEAWKKVCQETALAAIPLVIDILTIVKNKDANAFKEKMLCMCGMDGKDEVVAVAGQTVYSTLGNATARDIVARLNSSECELYFSKNNQGIRWSFDDSIGTVYFLQMPFTINKNGAWWSKGTVNSAKNVHDRLAGDPREGKRNEIASSTNMWVNPRQIFGAAS